MIFKYKSSIEIAIFKGDNREKMQTNVCKLLLTTVHESFETNKHDSAYVVVFVTD